MLDFDIILGLFESHAHLLTSEYVSVKVLAEDLSCFIINFVLRIDHDAVLGSSFKKYFSNYFRMTRVYKHQLRHHILLALENFPDFVSRYRGKLPNGKF